MAASSHPDLEPTNGMLVVYHLVLHRFVPSAEFVTVMVGGAVVAGAGLVTD